MTEICKGSSIYDGGIDMFSILRYQWFLRAQGYCHKNHHLVQFDENYTLTKFDENYTLEIFWNCTV